MSTAMSPATISVDACSGISVAGILDATTVADLNRAVREFFSSADLEDLEVLTLDLSTVTRCDEAALAAVRYARAACTDHAVALRVIPSDAVRHVICPRP
jgi:ABC-type transporter Mla MlaB component